MSHTQTMRRTHLLSCKLLFVLLPARANPVARFATIARFQFRSLVGIVLFHRLLRIVVAEPFRILLQCRGVVKRMRVGRASAPRLVWGRGVGTTTVIPVPSSRVRVCDSRQGTPCRD